MYPDQNEEKKIEYNPELEGLPTKRKIDPEIEKEYRLEILKEPKVKDGQYLYANPGDFVSVKYKAWDADSNEFLDDNGGQPVAFCVGQEEVTVGWDEVMMQLAEGHVVKFYCPYQKAYGDMGVPGTKIRGKLNLLYEVELESVTPLS